MFETQGRKNSPGRWPRPKLSLVLLILVTFLISFATPTDDRISDVNPVLSLKAGFCETQALLKTTKNNSSHVRKFVNK